MAISAQQLEVREVMRPTVDERHDVVNLQPLGGSAAHADTVAETTSRTLPQSQPLRVFRRVRQPHLEQ